jgi:hypothetical protein
MFDKAPIVPAAAQTMMVCMGVDLRNICPLEVEPERAKI